ncbi:MAG: hypothetical protein Q8909_02465 [Bacteroidota bacterium]|nr:hypothetical protein [Bacteroidota bacterium]
MKRAEDNRSLGKGNEKLTFIALNLSTFLPGFFVLLDGMIVILLSIVLSSKSDTLWQQNQLEMAMVFY